MVPMGFSAINWVASSKGLFPVRPQGQRCASPPHTFSILKGWLLVESDSGNTANSILADGINSILEENEYPVQYAIMFRTKEYTEMPMITTRSDVPDAVVQLSGISWMLLKLGCILVGHDIFEGRNNSFPHFVLYITQCYSSNQPPYRMLATAFRCRR